MSARIPTTMRAVVLTGRTRAEDVHLTEVPVPAVRAGIFSLSQFNPISDIPNGVYLTRFHSNWPDQKTMGAIFDFFTDHCLKPRVGAEFPFSRIREALIAQDEGAVNGKIVVTVDGQ